MKIVHLIFQMLTGGMETMLVDIANEQARKGHEVEILIVNKGEDAKIISTIDSRIKITRFNRKPGANPFLLIGRLNLWMLRHRPDIIHIHMHKLTGALRVMRKHALYTVHTVNIPMTYAAPYQMAAISEVVANDVRQRVKNPKIEIISNGINTEKIARRPAGPLHSPIRIVQVSRLFCEQKGQDILIEAVRILKNRGIDISLTFIGEGPDLAKLQQLADGLDVTFAGNLSRKEIYSSLRDFDIMCHPSRREGFGLVVAEGMAAGLPLAVPEEGGPWEITVHGRFAETFANGDAESCAQALMNIINDYDNSLKLADKALSHVTANYSVRRMVEEYDTLYRKMLAKKIFA